LTYAEALYDAKDQQKGDRNEVGNRQALGVHDSFLPDGGGAHRTFEPLWWRVWRYLDLDIQTAGEPLTLDSLQAEFTAYPFEERASFDGARIPSWRRYGRSAGERRGSMRTRRTWILLIGNSYSMWATPGSRR
jgi:hypothetical protein